MARLSISLLGPFQVRLDGETVTAFESNKARALLAYLAVESDRPHHRGKLAGLLWPDQPEQDARKNLRYALSKLRRAIGDRAADSSFLHISRETVQFNPASDAWVDVTVFSDLLDAPSQNSADWQAAVKLYRGDFLEGLSVDSVPLEEWLLLQRERVQRQVLAALHRLASLHAQRGGYKQALAYAWRQVEMEPWQEKAQRQLMRLLALDGQRGVALAQYEACCRVLEEELGVKPTGETTNLYEQIRAGLIGPAQADTLPRPGQAQFQKSTAMAPSQAGKVVKVTTPTRTGRPGWQTRAKNLTILGGGFLLLAILLVIGAMLLLRTQDKPSGALPAGASTPLRQPSPAPTCNKVITQCDELFGGDDGNPFPQICSIDLRSGQITRVTQDLEFEQIGPVSWSPDGQQVLFSAGTDQCDDKIYLLAADGSDLKKLTSGDTCDSSATWSPDGEWIAFIRDGHLWRIRPDGSTEQRLWFSPTDPFVVTASWSPDSQQIAFLRSDQGQGPWPEDLWVIHTDGTAARKLYSFERPLRPGIFPGTLLWSPDGQQILCFYEYEGQQVTLAMPLDGSGEPQRVSQIPLHWSPASWPQWCEPPLP